MNGDRTAVESIAVMPFVNAGADPNLEYLADGIAESLINSLSQLPNLTVMSRSAVFRYKGKEVDPQAVGRDLKVQAVLISRLTQRGDTLSISTELVDVTWQPSHLGRSVQPQACRSHFRGARNRARRDRTTPREIDRRAKRGADEAARRKTPRRISCI